MSRDLTREFASLQDDLLTLSGLIEAMDQLTSHIKNGGDSLFAVIAAAKPIAKGAVQRGEAIWGGL
ncbi:hypothetical protein [Rhodobacter sp. JA431]|uniref:hypothetical protein n=1 Tax=Rhodobacter sp. JA431 TaxID=570013 RepID=UPI001BAF1885|nr:hypothetical protein [Rhodobacter sp. JA431]